MEAIALRTMLDVGTESAQLCRMILKRIMQKNWKFSELAHLLFHVICNLISLYLILASAKLKLVRLPQLLISMSMQKLYTNRSSFAQSARFSRPGASLSILPKKKLGQLVLKLFSNAERKTDWVFGNVWSCSTLFIMKTSHKSDELKKIKKGELHKSGTYERNTAYFTIYSL